MNYVTMLIEFFYHEFFYHKKRIINVLQLLILRCMDVGDATSTTSMDVVKVGLENQVGRDSRLKN